MPTPTPEELKKVNEFLDTLTKEQREAMLKELLRLSK